MITDTAATSATSQIAPDAKHDRRSLFVRRIHVVGDFAGSCRSVGNFMLRARLGQWTPSIRKDYRKMVIAARRRNSRMAATGWPPPLLERYLGAHSRRFLPSERGHVAGAARGASLRRMTSGSGPNRPPGSNDHVTGQLIGLSSCSLSGTATSAQRPGGRSVGRLFRFLLRQHRGLSLRKACWHHPPAPPPPFPLPLTSPFSYTGFWCRASSICTTN